MLYQTLIAWCIVDGSVGSALTTKKFCFRT